MRRTCTFLVLSVCISCSSADSPARGPADPPSSDEDERADDDEGDTTKAPSTMRDSGQKAPAGTTRMDAATGTGGKSTAPDGGNAPDADIKVVDNGGNARPVDPFAGEGTPWLTPVARTVCGASDLKDTTLQGAAGDWRCNLDLVDRLEVPTSATTAFYKDCAYVNSSDGTTAIHVAADGKLSAGAKLTQTGFKANWESLKANEQSGLLAGYESLGSTIAIADVSKDCKKPVFLANLKIPGSALGESLGHAGNFNPDGTIYYPTSLFTLDVSAVDLKDPKKPVVIAHDFAGLPSHDLFIGKGGTRAYMASAKDLGQPGDPKQVGSVAIMDTSEIEARKPGAKATLVKLITWEDGNATQYPIAVTYRGRDHLIISDELGSGSCGDPTNPIWGYARILDISDERDPKTVALVRTEAQHPDFCDSPAQAEPGAVGFGVGTHYCNVDRLEDPRVLACGNWAAGLRVYDIRNPWQPKELAYYSIKSEEAAGRPQIVVSKREIWFATTPGAFYVVKIRAGSALDEILAGP